MADAQTFSLTNKKQFLALLKDADLKKDKLQSISGELGARIKEASDNGYLHRGAFGLMLKLHRMEEDKRAEFLRNFEAYRDYANEAQLWGSEHVGDLAEMAKAETEAAEQRFDAEEAQVAANTEALEGGIKKLPTPAEMADAFEAGRIAFLDGKGGVIPDGMSAKLGEEWLRGWRTVQDLPVEERLALKGNGEAPREPDAEFDDATATKPSRRGRKAGVGEGGDAAGTYAITH